MRESTRGWDLCQQGELTRLGSALAFQRRLRVALFASLALIACGGLASGSWLAYSAISPAAPMDPQCGNCHNDEVPCKGAVVDP
jgi:hypothetical protein